MKHKLNIAVGCLALLFCFFFFRNSGYFWAFALAIVILFNLILSFGILFLRFEYFYPATFQNSREPVILTFDDGPDPERTPQVLEILRKHNIRALFFVIGDKALKYPELVKQMLDGGHIIGNHTQTHPLFFAMYSRKKIAQELDQGIATLRQFQSSNELFRPPIGYMNPSIARELKKRNLKIVGWNVRSYDSFKNTDQLLQRLLRLTQKGSVVLMHDNLDATIQVLETYIQQAKSFGIIFANQEQLKKFVHEVHQ